ncbi:hypothetical protein [Ornithinibacillus bavariensis]|uniref:hypothetical protein n=1 Tax=Ornithinibacillus bavariensis TaxID=545502 RepID=UPI000ED8F9F5|nr:hypothetical protein [Ornithinibacillus sp.]
MIKLNVTTHSGDDDIIEVEAYDAKELEDKRNNNELESIAIGDNVYSRIDLKNIKRIREELEQLNEN